MGGSPKTAPSHAQSRANCAFGRWIHTRGMPYYAGHYCPKRPLHLNPLCRTWCMRVLRSLLVSFFFLLRACDEAHALLQGTDPLGTSPDSTPGHPYPSAPFSGARHRRTNPAESLRSSWAALAVWGPPILWARNRNAQSLDSSAAVTQKRVSKAKTHATRGVVREPGMGGHMIPTGMLCEQGRPQPN